MDSFSAPLLRILFGSLSLALAAPVVFYSASDYWRSARLCLRRRVLTLDVPIALGLAALYAQSAFEIISGRGAGYLDSLAGLIFFLLCGRAFQQKTFDRIAFDRDYKCFFPLSVIRKTAAGEESVALSGVRVGDRLLVRNGEMIPADATLASGQGFIDYSFVTGESEAVAKKPGDYLYAGGQQTGETLEIEIVKPVSQSYLASLWNDEAFQKEREGDVNTLTNQYGRWFTLVVIAAALGAGLFWLGSGNTARAIKAFTSVLIVACPCALALAAPFALGTAQRLLARIQVFVKNTLVLERMAEVDAIVFDKTGTLTAAQAGTVMFCGKTGTLSPTEQSFTVSLARHSTHPQSGRIAWAFAGADSTRIVEGFAEEPGCGISGKVEGHEVRLGSRSWLDGCGVTVPALDLPPGSVSCLAMDGRFRGAFVSVSTVRPDAGQLLRQLGMQYEIALLSGDNERERELFRGLFGGDAPLNFNQSPLDKLGFIRGLQSAGKAVIMVGDGLNDAGALKQSDVGIAVVESVGSFSPASDVILASAEVPRLFEILMLARKTRRIVRLSFGLSALYNAAGITVAAAGLLSPIICAVLMPLSSLSVVLFACGATNRAASKLRQTK